MRRLVTSPLLLVLVVAGVAPGQPTPEPEVATTVYYLDPATKKEVSLDGGVVEETVAGIKLKVGKEFKVIPALDVRQVTYKTKVNPLEYRKAFSTERKALEPGGKADKKIELLGIALNEFKALANDVKDVPQAARYIAFKAAEVHAAIGREDEKKLPAAIKAVADFRTAHPRGWETLPALKLQAELHELASDPDGAAKVYEEMTALPDAPKEVQNAAQLLVGQMLLRAKKYADAEKGLTAARGGLSPADPQRAATTILICQARLLQNKADGVDKELAGALAATADPVLLAVGHNCLGDFHRAKKQDDQAFWAYLKVYLLLPQDRTEHARAMYHLAKLFDTAQKDPIRAQEVLDKLLADKDYNGTEWQAKAKAESEKKPANP